MKIYFVGSISGRSRFLSHYSKIVKLLESMGHHVFEDTLTPSTDDVLGLSDEEKIDFYKQVLQWINASDLVIAEVSHPSLGVGHEISLALERSKPVVVLYSEGSAPHFLEGLESERLVIEKYEEDSLERVLTQSLDFAKDQSDTRFNFFISPRHVSYLDWVAKNKRIPRSVYLRNLIKEDMNKNSEHSA